MIKSPPKKLIPNPMQVVMAAHAEQIEDYLSLFSPLDAKGRYLHFDELRFRLPKGVDTELAWSVVKSARHRQVKTVIKLGSQSCPFYLTPTMQKAISEADRYTTTAALEWMTANVGEQTHLTYLLNDLVEDEAISSSQLEGAATTTKVAKDLLKRSRKPRTPDEKMILGNYKMMNFAWQNRHKDLSVALIEALHKIGVEDIDNDHYTPGVFRKTDDVEVVDADGNTVHTPPPAEGLTARLKQFCKWVNKSHHDGDNRDYLHPLIKAIVMHFTIGYEHPFRDGNGRVARALFYWYMFKNDFSAFRYIAISILLKEAPIQYGKSYLHTETDEMDLTYFVEYQSGIITRAISKFRNAYQQSVSESQAFDQWLWQSGLIKQLSDKQKTLLQVARNGLANVFTASLVKENLGCSYNTANTALNGLVDLNLFVKRKEGREWVYSMRNQKKILHDWQSNLD